MKTNKSFTKRLKVTRNGKDRRTKGRTEPLQCKRRAEESSLQERSMRVHFSNKAKARFLPGMFKKSK